MGRFREKYLQNIDDSCNGSIESLGFANVISAFVLFSLGFVLATIALVFELGCFKFLVLKGDAPPLYPLQKTIKTQLKT